MLHVRMHKLFICEHNAFLLFTLLRFKVTTDKQGAVIWGSLGVICHTPEGSPRFLEKI